MRAVEVLDAGGRWRPGAFEALAEGSVFRLLEPGGEVVRDAEGCGRFRALGPAYKNEAGQWAVDSEPVPETAVEREARTGAGWFPGSSGRRPGGPPSRLR